VRRVAIAGVVLVLGLAGCGDDDGGGSGAHSVQAQDFRFAPATVTVPAGTTVEWRNTGRTDHTIKGPGFFSRAVSPGGRWSHRFTKPGSFDYVCTLHPDAMRARVVVSE
jgi:plastocyanin